MLEKFKRDASGTFYWNNETFCNDNFHRTLEQPAGWVFKKKRCGFCRHGGVWWLQSSETRALNSEARCSLYAPQPWLPSPQFVFQFVQAPTSLIVHIPKPMIQKTYYILPSSSEHNHQELATSSKIPREVTFLSSSVDTTACSFIQPKTPNNEYLNTKRGLRRASTRNQMGIILKFSAAGASGFWHALFLRINDQ